VFLDEYTDFSKQPPVKIGGIAEFRLSLPDFVGCFHLPVKTGGIEIGTNKSSKIRNNFRPSYS
jgi:hypothetical protein